MFTVRKSFEKFINKVRDHKSGGPRLILEFKTFSF